MHRPPGLSALYSAWRRESNLLEQYPDNDQSMSVTS